MATVQSNTGQLLVSLYNRLKYVYQDVWDIHGDPRVKHLPLMASGPWSTLFIIISYLYFVKYVGPHFMRNRKPLELKNVILVYNVLLIIINGVFFAIGTWITRFGLDSWKCEEVNHHSREFLDLFKIQLGWMYLMTKFIDFFDTFFFIVRKKQRQVSSLHVFHHSVMPFFVWLGLKFVPGGNSAFLPWINSGIHTIMYTYYALSLFEHARPYLWWKVYITKLQMLQFVLVIVHSAYSMLIPNCKWPKPFMYLSIFNAFVFLIMFTSFFRRTYRLKAKHN